MPVTFVNLGFEIQGTYAGQAAGWTVSSAVAAGAVAGFGPPLEQGFEDFRGGWLANETDIFAFTAGSIEACEFHLWEQPGLPDVQAWEDFERGWANFPFIVTLGGLEAAVFGHVLPSPINPETFYGGWPSDVFITYFDPSFITSAQFVGPKSVEDFADGWKNNQNDITAFVPATHLVVASFGYYAGTQPCEDFESVYIPRVFLADPSTDELRVWSSHGLLLSDQLVVWNMGGRLPAPLAEEQRYEVVLVPTPLTLKVGIPGGAAVDIQDTGIEVHYLAQDPTKYWHEMLSL